MKYMYFSLCMQKLKKILTSSKHNSRFCREEDKKNNQQQRKAQEPYMPTAVYSLPPTQRTQIS